MTQQEAQQLAAQYQKQRNRTGNYVSARRIGQDLIDAFVEAHGTHDPATCPDWMRPSPHWAVLFDRQTNSVPAHHVIVVYDDGYVTETPAL